MMVVTQERWVNNEPSFPTSYTGYKSPSALSGRRSRAQADCARVAGGETRTPTPTRIAIRHPWRLIALLLVRDVLAHQVEGAQARMPTMQGPSDEETRAQNPRRIGGAACGLLPVAYAQDQHAAARDPGLVLIISACSS